MWLSKLIGNVFLSKEIDNHIDFTKDKYFIRKLIKNKSLELKKNKLILCCILSALVYRYNEIKLTKSNVTASGVSEMSTLSKNEMNEENEMNATSKESEAVKEFNEICASWDLNKDNTRIYNIKNILIFGVFYINNNLFITFKGTSTLNDFLADLDITQVNFTVPQENIKIPGKVHKGAYEILFENDRYKYILNIISHYKGKNIYITGHSLGGLLGTIFYSFLKEYLKNTEINIKLITFGSPRVGNNVYSKTIHYNSSTRIVNDNDCVAKLPLPINYTHNELLFHIGKVKNKNFFFNIKQSIEDHRIENYYKNLFLLE